MRRKQKCCLARLAQHDQGSTLVEFAIVAPIFFGILMFIFDMGYMAYARSVLRGEVNAVGRASTMETATNENQAAMDARLEEVVGIVVPQGDFAFNRVSFGSYGLAQARAEPFVDDNDSNDCDDGESFLDLNGNGQYDLDGSRAGGGGARDVVIYTVTVRYDRMFPVAGLLGLSNTVELQASSLLKNQPFDQQRQPTTGFCT